MNFWFRSFFDLFSKILWIKKWPDPKNFFIQKSVFSCLLTRRNDFWNPFILRSYFHNCLPGLLTHIANQLSLLTKKYLTSKVHFDIIYLKITENARSVTTKNTLILIKNSSKSINPKKDLLKNTLCRRTSLKLA